MLTTPSGSIAPRVERHGCETDPPTTFVHRDGLLPGALLLVLSTIWIGVPLRAMTMTHADPIPGLGTPGALVAFVIGAGFALWSVEALTRRRMIVIDDHSVAVRERRLGQVRQWRAQLDDYLGVHVRSEKIRTARGRKLLHVVELRHGDPCRTLILATSKDWHEAMRECRILAQSLGIEQLEDSRTAGGLPPVPPVRGRTVPHADASPEAIAANPWCSPASEPVKAQGRSH